MDSSEQPSDTKVAVQDVNIEILPAIYEIIKSIERDHHETSAKTRESQDCSLKVLELEKRLDQARSQINLLAGIEFSKEQQLNHLEALKTQLRLKQELIHKYRYFATVNMVIRLIMKFLANNEQLVHQLSESGPIRAAARFVVGIFNRSKNMIEEHDLDKKLSPEKIKEMAKKFTENIKEEVNEAKENIKRGKKS